MEIDKRTEFCPCGRLEVYTLCCAQKHQRLSNAITAEDLMRSRYTAFTLGMGDFLLKSHHSTTRPTKNIAEIIKWAKSVEWLFLEVLNVKDGGRNDLVGYIEFKAHFTENKKKSFIHEKSKFIRENGDWVYLGFSE